MFTWIKIAFRNLIKNRRRSLVTISAIAFGLAAVILFGGFTTYMYNGNRDAAIYTSFKGHLNVTRKGFWEAGQIDPAIYLLTPSEIERVEAICKQIPEILLVTPQLNLTGLLSNGKISTIFIARGIVPSSMEVFLSRTMWKDIIGINRNKLEDDKFYGVAVAKGLARLLDLQEGSYGMAVSTTVEGQINALDLEIFQLFEAPNEQINDKIMRVPFGFAQRLYDTQGADRLVILLERSEDTDRIRDRLVDSFAEQGLDLEVRTWVERSQWYRNVKDMFDVIFLFLFIIVFVISVMSIVNTMSMAVLERTREIGTLRALGLKRRGVLLLFALEAALIGLGGTIGGLLLGFTGWWWVDYFKPTWTPPGMTAQIPLRIEFVPEFTILSFLILMLLCVISSLIPAVNAARQNVIDALGHV